MNSPGRQPGDVALKLWKFSSSAGQPNLWDSLQKSGTWNKEIFQQFFTVLTVVTVGEGKTQSQGSSVLLFL